MALMLRKLCQEVLDIADLNAFHADIHEDSKRLALFTPCGKLFATAHGIKFASTRPSNDEMVYAVELLQTWLRRNERTITDYLIAFETVERIKDELDNDTLPDGYQFQAITKGENRVDPYNHNRRTYTNVVTGYLIRSHLEVFKFNLAHEIVRWEGLKYKEFNTTRQINTKFGLPASTIKAATARCEDRLAYQDAKALMDSIHAELNSCKE